VAAFVVACNLQALREGCQSLTHKILVTGVPKMSFQPLYENVDHFTYVTVRS
jgi:hypothetical protein